MKNYKKNPRITTSISTTLNEMYQKLLNKIQVALNLRHLYCHLTLNGTNPTSLVNNMLVMQDIVNCIAFKTLMQLIKVRWITFKKTPNINVNHASRS